MIAFFVLTLCAWLGWGLMSLRAVSVWDRFTRPEKLVGITFLAATYIMAFGMSQAIQAL